MFSIATNYTNYQILANKRLRRGTYAIQRTLRIDIPVDKPAPHSTLVVAVELMAMLIRLYRLRPTPNHLWLEFLIKRNERYEKIEKILYQISMLTLTIVVIVAAFFIVIAITHLHRYFVR